MKQYVLTKPYATLEAMINSDEVARAKEELQKGEIKEYAIVSRIGNRYDLNANKILGYALNPYYQEKTMEDKKDMKYTNIEAIIDQEIATAVEKANIQHAQEIAKINADHEKEVIAIKEKHAADLVKAKDLAKAELLAKLNA